MAKGQQHRKCVDVKAYKRAKPGGVYKKITVKRHQRSASD
jgi:hypothetical protein